MKIKTYYDPPPIPVRRFDWCAYDDDTYSGDAGQPLGWGETEAEAVSDLLSQIDEGS